ncbi:MAG: hypothetical protein HRT35_34880, partial [Algicola sp.]|nr:hypothetical protein [Algicola sp.]
MPGQLHTINITNAGQSTFAKGWKDYQAMASYDQQAWFRVPTRFNGEQLTIEHASSEPTVYYAYFTPYLKNRHQSLLSQVTSADLCQHKVLGYTPDGNVIDQLIIGEEGQNKQKVWITARQHPGETMAQWFVDGLINALLNGSPLSENILDKAVFYIMPNMNPDGSASGNHRTNARGVNLNRQWALPDETDCPEVFHVRQAMLDTGVDMFFDIHGDEVLPYNFMMGGFSSPELTQQAADFKGDYAAANSDFQVEYDYDNTGGGCCTETSGCGKAKLTTATAFVEHQFECLSLLLEMPFTGWSAQRSIALGQSLLEPIGKALKVTAHPHNILGSKNQLTPRTHHTEQNSAIPGLHAPV